MEQEKVTLSIRVNEAYRQSLDRIKSVEGQRKCRSWIDLMEPVDGMAEVELTPKGILLRCKGKKGMLQESCTYDGVLGVTEWQEGIFLRLSHKRVLLIPVTDCPSHNRSVAQAMTILNGQCKYCFKRSNLSLKGLSPAERVGFRLRPRQGYSLSARGAKGYVIALIVCALLIGTVFVTEPLRHRKMEQADALTASGRVATVRIFYRRGHVQDGYLDLADGESYHISSVCLNKSLAQQLAGLKGRQVQLLIHPKSGDVLQIEWEGEVLLEFHRAMERQWNNALGFTFLGVFMYTAGGYLIYELLFKENQRRRKRKCG